MRKLSKNGLVLLALLSTVLSIQLSFAQVSVITCIEKEREALLRLKKSFDDPFHRLASWKGTNCCNWNGVDCNETTGHITKIDLRNNDEVGIYSPLYSNSIDSSLLEFKYLNYLDLSRNSFNYSQIPNFLGSMLELRYLNLSCASFSGKVPPHIGNLTKLAVLDLSSYGYDYADRWKSHLIGDVEWISRLSSLQILDLSGMNFLHASNLMQVLSSIPLLSSLRLKFCYSLLPNIQVSLGSLNSSFLTRIELLDLSVNKFTGPIPKTFQNMTSLKYLYLSWNKFTTIEGGLSSFIGNNCRLKEFDLSLNEHLVGDVFGSYENVSVGCDLQVLDLFGTTVRNKIPNWLGMLKHLQSISLYGSNIHGLIPASLGNLSNIQYLDLSHNDLSGTIPTSFERLFNLRRLDLGFNRLEGEVGVELFSQLGSLEDLDISKNLLKGVVTEAHFVNLSRLHTLRIGYNELLSLDMKSNWVPPFQLNILDASSCMGFGSKFPQWLQTQKSLVGLLLSNTSISGALPAWLRAQNLTHLELSDNKMEGLLPASIGDQMPNLKRLRLKNNLFNDSLPPSVCKWKHLEFLDLSNNRLSGTVDGCLLTFYMLLLDLSSNTFCGTFPYSHGNLSNIQHLYLRNNHFEGSMPIILKNSTSLEFLDLEGNQFFGNIPAWVGDNLKGLKFLILRDNLFNGTIPSSLCLLTYMQILDLAHNQLEGNIPLNLRNFGLMTGKIPNQGVWAFCSEIESDCDYTNEKQITQHFKLRDFGYSVSQLISMMNIDLSNNSLVGFIPSEITTLKGLIGLNLSHNNLIGTIPTEMGAIESLESLDLSFNRLSGSIPQSMSKLSSLEVLKLSHNNLSGNIPRGGHLLAFNEASSFDDNPFLCGDPLPKKCVIEKPFQPPHVTENLDQDEDKWEKWLLYTMIILGFATGFLAVVGGLILKRSWRYAYFKFVDETQYKVHAAMSRSIEKMKEICTQSKS